MALPQDEREGMILTLSTMTNKSEEYFEDMDDRRLIEEYDRLLRII